MTTGEAVGREPGAERTRRASLDRNRALASALSRAQPAVTAERMPCAPSRVEVRKQGNTHNEESAGSSPSGSSTSRAHALRAASLFFLQLRPTSLHWTQ